MIGRPPPDRFSIHSITLATQPMQVQWTTGGIATRLPTPGVGLPDRNPAAALATARPARRAGRQGDHALSMKADNPNGDWEAITRWTSTRQVIAGREGSRQIAKPAYSKQDEGIWIMERRAGARKFAAPARLQPGLSPDGSRWFSTAA